MSEITVGSDRVFPILESNITRRIDFALFMVDALVNDDLIREAPAIVGCKTDSARKYSSTVDDTSKKDTDSKAGSKN